MKVIGFCECRTRKHRHGWFRRRCGARVSYASVYENGEERMICWACIDLEQVYPCVF